MKQHDTVALREAIASKFDTKIEELQLIRSFGNLVYNAGDKIIRLTHCSLRPISNIEAELYWLKVLHEAGVTVVGLLPSTQGNAWEVISTAEDEFFTTVAFEKLAGERITAKEWTPAHFNNLGQITAQLHVHSQQLEVPSHISYPVWDEIMEHDAYQFVPTNQEEYGQLYLELTSLFNSYGKQPDNYGLIHYDIHQGNYFAQPDRIVVFDFEMVCHCWYMHDVATVLYYACMHPGSAQYPDFETTFMHHFWEGYEGIHQLNLADRAMIAPYLLYRDLMVYGYLGKVWQGQEITAKDQAYLEHLRASIEKRRTTLRL